MFRLSIVTPERPLFDDEVRSLVVPGSEGYLGVLTDHAPLLTALVPGELKFTDGGDRERIYALSGGFFEVAHNHATVLADAIEEPGAIDVARAQEALERAHERLKERASSHVDEVRAELAYLRAKNRLEIARDHARQK